MRRIIAGSLALAAAVSTLTACGGNAENSGKGDSGSVSSECDAEEFTAAETEPETETPTEPEADAAAESAGITAEECDAVLKKIVDAVKSGDKDKLAGSCLTDYSYNAVKDFGLLDIFVESLDIPGGGSDLEVRIVREADASVKNAAKLRHSMYAHYYGTMAEAGMNYKMLIGEAEMTREQTQLFAELSPLMSETNFARSEYTDTVRFDEYVMVTVGGVSGDGTPFESQIGAFRAPGEDVKIDLMADYGYIPDSSSTADSAARAVYDAANAALEELSADGADISGVHLLSMNSLANAGSLNGSYEELFDRISGYVSFDDYLEFFIVTVDGRCGYAAAVTNAGAVAAYPENTKFDAINQSDHGQVCHVSEINGILDYDELYSSAVGAIGG